MRHLLLFSLAALSMLAQQPINPDCSIQLFNATATGTSGNLDNRGFNCVDWTVTIQFRGFTGASVELDSAPDNNGAPGAFTPFGGSVITGANPTTVFVQNSATATMTNFFPWLRLNITSLTGAGSINVIAAGFRPIGFPLLKSGAVSASNITQIGGFNVSACNQQAIFNFSVAGNAQLIAASGSNRILICHYDVAFASAVDFKLTYGTTANCAAGTTDLTGLKKNIVTDAEDYGPFSPLIAPASQGVCGNSSAVVAGGLTIIFAQIP
jgi:hypothetical protein